MKTFLNIYGFLLMLPFLLLTFAILAPVYLVIRTRYDK